MFALYTTVDGRISRKQWWLGAIGLAVAGLILGFLFAASGFSPIPDLRALAESDADGATFSAAINAAFKRTAWLNLLLLLILAYPSYCLSVKRRHDRDNAGHDVLVYTALTALLGLFQALGVGIVQTDIGNGFTAPGPSMWLSIVYVVPGILGIYLFVVLGFLRGTSGSNRYGADPVLGPAVAT